MDVRKTALEQEMASFAQEEELIHQIDALNEENFLLAEMEKFKLLWDLERIVMMGQTME